MKLWLSGLLEKMYMMDRAEVRSRGRVVRG